MGKIDQIIVFPNPGYDTGETAKDKVNNAMKTVETDATLTGDGNTGTELKLNPAKTVTRIRSTLSVVTNNINLDLQGANELKANNRVAITANVTLTLLNYTNGEYIGLPVEISNSATITLINPDGGTYTIVSEDGGNVLDLGNGKFTISIAISATEIEILRTNAVS
jgi:hypothetical protein